jgi:hypothetical protein
VAERRSYSKIWPFCRKSRCVLLQVNVLLWYFNYCTNSARRLLCTLDRIRTKLNLAYTSPNGKYALSIPMANTGTCSSYCKISFNIFLSMLSYSTCLFPTHSVAKLGLQPTETVTISVVAKHKSIWVRRLHEIVL